MSDKLKDVIAKMKEKQVISPEQLPTPSPAQADAVPQTAPVPAPVPAPIQQNTTAEAKETVQVEENPVPAPKVDEKPSQEELEERKQRIAMEIELLQNDGRFRAEILHQFQEINKSLMVIAGVLVELAGK